MFSLVSLPKSEFCTRVAHVALVSLVSYWSRSCVALVFQNRLDLHFYFSHNPKMSSKKQIITFQKIFQLY